MRICRTGGPRSSLWLPQGGGPVGPPSPTADAPNSANAFVMSPPPLLRCEPSCAARRTVTAAGVCRRLLSERLREWIRPLGSVEMERLWSRAVATGGNRWQMRRRRKRPKEAKTVAVGCDQLPPGPHGKEGVDGSSPSEGLKYLQICYFCCLI